MGDRLPFPVLLLLVFLVIVPARPAWSFEWNPITDADWQAVDATPVPPAGATMLFERMAEDDSLLFRTGSILTVYRRIAVQNASGRQWADVTIPYFHKQQFIEEVEGRVVQRDGSSTSLARSEVRDTEVLKARGKKVKSIAFSIPGVTDQCIIEYHVRYRLPEGNGSWIVQKPMPLVDGEYRWRYYRGAELDREVLDIVADKWKMAATYMLVYANLLVTAQAYPNAQQQTEFIFSAHDVPAFEEEPFSLPEDVRIPRVRLFYLESGKADAYWIERAAAVDDNFESQMRGATEVGRLAGGFKKAEPPATGVEEAYRWTQQNVKNTTYARTPRSCGDAKTVDAIVKAKCASQTGINTLFLALLRKMDLDATLAFAVDRDEGAFVPAAKYWQFDRSLVVLRDGAGTTRYLSPGDPYLEPGDVPWLNEGAKAYVVRKGAGKEATYELLDIPFSPPDSNRTVRVVTLTLNLDQSTVTGDVDEMRTGHRARDARLICHETSAARMVDDLKKAIGDDLTAVEVDSIKVVGAANPGGLIRIDSHIKSTLSEQAVPGRVVIEPLGILRKQENPFTATRRQGAIVFDYAYELDETVIVAAPDGMTVEAVPADVAFSNSVGTSEVRFTRDGDKARVRHRLRINEPWWEVEDYAKVQTLFTKEADLSSMAIVFAGAGSGR